MQLRGLTTSGMKEKMRNKRTIFWTLITDSQRQRETHQSNWVWYADGTGTKPVWKKDERVNLWKSTREPLFKKGIYGTISLGEIIKAFGTPDDKKQWCKTLENIGLIETNAGLETAQPQSTTASSEETNK